MGFIFSLRRLVRHRLLLGLGFLLAAFLAAYTAVQSSPATVSASTQILVDAGQSPINDTSQGFDPVVPRATVYGNLMTSPALLDVIGRAAGIPGDEISAAGPVGPDTGVRVLQPATAGPGGYSLQFDTDPTLPIIRVTSKAPTGRQAAALAAAVGTGLASYLSHIADVQNVSAKNRVVVRELGAPAVVSKSKDTLVVSIAILVAVALGWCVVLLIAMRFRDAWRRSAGVQRPHAPTPSDDNRVGQPAVNFATRRVNHNGRRHGSKKEAALAGVEDDGSFNLSTPHEPLR